MIPNFKPASPFLYGLGGGLSAGLHLLYRAWHVLRCVQKTWI